MNILTVIWLHVQVCLQELHLGVKLLGCRVCTLSRLDNNKLFSKMVVLIYTPASSIQDLLFMMLRFLLQAWS